MLLRDPSSGFLLLLRRPRPIGGLLRLYTSTAGASGAGGISCREPHFMLDYLITSCGLSFDEASKASKYLSHLKSTKKPDSVLNFFRSHGFDDTHLRKIVSRNPRWLCRDVEKILAPKFRAFQDLGFSGPILIQLILSEHRLIDHSLHRSILPRFEFWRRLLGSMDRVMKLVRNKSCFLGTNIEKTVMPNLSLLQERGIPDSRTAVLLQKSPILILRKPATLKALVERAERMGIPRSSRMFLWALSAVDRVSEAKLDAKLRLLKSFGWSEVEFYAALRKDPTFITVSDKLLSAKMEFFLKEVGRKPLEIARCAKLLMYSLEKRLIPRHQVMQKLKARGLYNGDYNPSSVMNMSEKKFMRKYIFLHEEKVPELLVMYIAQSGRGVAL
ncbi:transcription termination factor MTERF2, chloroplastic-like [Phoenix dactylifera]|uniref:Transcription termination factor MTERF2, chloroplastic-like n=1 Tax=Phoenix dactylifera TaxID=42345 RepID=A0A8B7CQW4_PHODC|nr:transcription termination factor MTERF2, chloroplastic-like [Phoenix dactylifera]